MEYFEIFELEPTFLLEESELKKRFYANSKRFHPDFHSQASDAEQQQILIKSSLNNKAYKVLREEYSRMGYILGELGLVGEGVKHDLPQAFLMEMMEVNESLMELQFDPDTERIAEAKAKVSGAMAELRSSVGEAMRVKPDLSENAGELEKIKDYYLKRKYMLRMLENLDRFAGAKDVDPLS